MERKVAIFLLKEMVDDGVGEREEWMLEELQKLFWTSLFCVANEGQNPSLYL